MKPKQKSWIGVDLDGTLAMQVPEKHGRDFIGEPVPPILEMVKAWLVGGIEVKIFTARVDGGVSGNPDSEPFEDVEQSRKVVEDWCLKHIGKVLEVTNVKNGSMMLLLDDRAVNVAHNKGICIPPIA